MSAGPSDQTWTLHRYAEPLAVARLAPDAPVPDWADAPAPITTVARTSAELSVTAAAAAVPAGVPTLGPYVAFSVDGVLDPSLVGVLADLLYPLTEERISILTISTYDTDWVLVPAELAEKAAEAWRRRGHHIA